MSGTNASSRVRMTRPATPTEGRTTRSPPRIRRCAASRRARRRRDRRTRTGSRSDVTTMSTTRRSPPRSARLRRAAGRPPRAPRSGGRAAVRRATPGARGDERAPGGLGRCGASRRRARARRRRASRRAARASLVRSEAPELGPEERRWPRRSRPPSLHRPGGRRRGDDRDVEGEQRKRRHRR